MAKRINLNDLKTFVASYVAAAKQAGTWVANKDSITGLVEKCAKTFTVDEGGFVDLLPELDAQEIQGYWEEYFAGLVPATGRTDDGSDELSPNRIDFDDTFYSYALTDATTGKPGVKFKTTVDDEYYERYINGGNEADLVNYIIKKLYDSYFTFKYQAKRQLIGNMITKALAAQAGEAYTTNSTIAKCGHIYVQSNKYYIMRRNMTAAENKTMVQLVSEGSATEITPSLVRKIAKPVDTSTAEQFIKQIKNDVEQISIGATEGTSLSGSTIGAVNSELMLYVAPSIRASLDIDALSGAFQVDRLAIPAMIKTLPDFGQISDSGVFAVLVDKRGLKMVENYVKSNATPVNGSLYENVWLHAGATCVLSKHVAVKVYTVTGA